MNQQVVPLLLDLKNVLSGQSDLFLNMANAGGTSFWGILLFFVSSPFSLLVAFIDTKDIYLFANILVFIKIVVCAGTASLFFRNKFTSLHVLQNIALSVMYAFCGYTMMYFQNVVWLDMMYMFPILLLGMDRIIQKEKVLLYMIALTAMITIHFYLCYMAVSYTHLDVYKRQALDHLPVIGAPMYRVVKKSKKIVKQMLYNTTIFEDMGFAYYGPFDGHDVENLIHVLENAKRMHQPVLLHMVTNKGKGYAFAEERPDTFHGVSKFDVATGEGSAVSGESFSNTFGEHICKPVSYTHLIASCQHDSSSII